MHHRVEINVWKCNLVLAEDLSTEYWNHIFYWVHLCCTVYVCGVLTHNVAVLLVLGLALMAHAWAIVGPAAVHNPISACWN